MTTYDQNSPQNREALLSCERLCKHFGGINAVSNLSFDVFPNEIFGIAGPNGAGKTTLLNIITHIPYPPNSGRVLFEDAKIEKLSAPQICKLGVARTFQIPCVFASLSVFDHLRIGSIYGRSGVQKIDRERLRYLIDILDLTGLAEVKDMLAGKLPLFEKKCLMLASALATDPALILLDEPMGGLDHSQIRRMTDLLIKVNKQGKTLVMIEHVISTLVEICDRLLIMYNGKKLAEGKCSDVIADQQVIEAYLGPRFRLRTDRGSENVTS